MYFEFVSINLSQHRLTMGGQMEAELCNCLLEEHFGASVAQVGTALLKEPGPLAVIASRLRGKLKMSTIRKSLVILEQFNIVQFKLDAGMRVTYSIDVEIVLALAKAPRCCLILKTLYDSLGDLVFLEIFYNGRQTCSETIRRVAAALGDPISKVKEVFCQMAGAQFIMRCPPVENTLKGCPQFTKVYDAYIVPDLIMQDCKDNDADAGVKGKAADRDAGIYWRINWSRFDRHIRDEMVLELLVPKDSPPTDRSANLCRQTVTAVLKANETRASSITANSTSPISVVDIMRCVRDNALTLEKKDVEWALRILVEESRGVLRRAGDSGGGLFLLDYERAIHLLSQTHIESLIREQLELKAVRIFRLLQSRGHLEEEHIEKLTMMSAKETRELLYSMLEEGYVFNKPIGRTNDFAPARTFYLYYVNMPQTVRGLTEYTCKALRNLMMKRKYETEQNKHLQEKECMILRITEEIAQDPDKDEETKNAETQDVQDTYMPAADRPRFEQYLISRNKLMAAESEVERTLFTFRLFLQFSLRKC